MSWASRSDLPKLIDSSPVQVRPSLWPSSGHSRTTSSSSNATVSRSPTASPLPSSSPRVRKSANRTVGVDHSSHTPTKVEARFPASASPVASFLLLNSRSIVSVLTTLQALRSQCPVLGVTAALDSNISVSYSRPKVASKTALHTCSRLFVLPCNHGTASRTEGTEAGTIRG
jgi:hypothetical protein